MPKLPKILTTKLYGVGYVSRPIDVKLGTRDEVIYQHWRRMLRRAYSIETRLTHKTYIGVMVCDEWHDYSKFLLWAKRQKHVYSKYELDKDILVKGNKIYSPETCCFVPQEINKLFNNRDSSRGKYPQGVTLNKGRNKFKAQISIDGTSINLGRYDTPKQAHDVYLKAKKEYISLIAKRWKGRIDDLVYDSLINYTV